MTNPMRLVLVILLLISHSPTDAQDENKPWTLSVGINAIDYYPVGQPDPQGNLLDEFFNANDNWNIIPIVSRLEVSKYFKHGISFSASGSFNKIKRFGTNVNPITRRESNNIVDDLTYYAFDGAINYSFNSNKLEPYISAGGGYTWLDRIGSGTLNGSLGLKYWFAENLAFNLQSTYKHVFETYGFRHFQHSASLTYKFGGDKDTDRDGISDINDTCPEKPGLLKFNGCPDTDSDGVSDNLDTCPKIAGLQEFNGCPDRDGDGVPDKEDKCPDVKGLKTLVGCPDADADNIPDSFDKCPNSAGPVENYGCPWPDTDGDGILDKDDKCPNIPGVIAENGCKIKLTEEDKKLLDAYAKTILFDSGKTNINRESEYILQDILLIINKNPNAKFLIVGHTDNIGSDILNLNLSQERAKSVKDYLILKGINQLRLSSRGFGEEKPIATNFTNQGRRLNRRVEILLNN